MAWQKSSPELIEFFDKVTAGLPGQRKSMFGYPVYFAENNHMFVGLYEDSLWVRVSEPDRAELLATVPGAALFEPMPGRPMREYVVLPPAVLRDEATFERWLQRALEYVRSLPVKETKPRKPKKKAD
jgi:TfoX/Sxy family transcriptional regulator of competence genes